MMKHDRLHDLVRRFVMVREADQTQPSELCQDDAELTDKALGQVSPSIPSEGSKYFPGLMPATEDW